MGKRVIAENQNEAAMQLVNSLIALEGVTGEVLSRTNGTSLPLNFFGSVIFGIIEDPSSVISGSFTPVLRK